jgi:hypothetical protein
MRYQVSIVTRPSNQLLTRTDQNLYLRHKTVLLPIMLDWVRDRVSIDAAIKTRHLTLLTMRYRVSIVTRPSNQSLTRTDLNIYLRPKTVLLPIMLDWVRDRVSIDAAIKTRHSTLLTVQDRVSRDRVSINTAIKTRHSTLLTVRYQVSIVTRPLNQSLTRTDQNLYLQHKTVLLPIMLDWVRDRVSIDAAIKTRHLTLLTMRYRVSIVTRPSNQLLTRTDQNLYLQHKMVLLPIMLDWVRDRVSIDAAIKTRHSTLLTVQDRVSRDRVSIDTRPLNQSLTRTDPNIYLRHKTVLLPIMLDWVRDRVSIDAAIKTRHSTLLTMRYRVSIDTRPSNQSLTRTDQNLYLRHKTVLLATMPTMLD